MIAAILGIMIGLPVLAQQDLRLEQLQSIEVLPTAYVYDPSSTLYTLSSVQSTRLLDGNLVGQAGGSDILLSSWDENLRIDRYVSMGSAFDDVGRHLSYRDGAFYVGGGFWDEMTVDQVQLSVTAGNRGAFMLKFSEALEAIRGLVLSSSNRVRLEKVIDQPDGTFLLIGSYEHDLYYNENLLFDMSRGIYFIQINDAFEVLSHKSIRCTGLIQEIQGFRRLNETILGVTFQDSLFLADTLYRTRDDDVQNSALLSVNLSGHVLHHQFIKTSFDQTLLLDETSEAILAHVNYGGNLVVGNFSLPGRPSNAQSTSVYFDNNLRPSKVSNWPGESPVALIAARFGEKLSLGRGKYNHWLSSSEKFPWISYDFESRLPKQIYFEGEDVLLTELVPFRSDVLVFGLFTGAVRARDEQLTTETNQYQPFVARISLVEPVAESPFFIYNVGKQTIEFIENNAESDIVIYDAMGRVRFRGKQSPSISISQFTAGLYIISMKAGESTRTAPFIKL